MIVVNLSKAKSIAHDARRNARAKEFAPLDIKATIPFEASAAEMKRQAVRERYAAIQASIDAASDVDELKLLISEMASL
jgi:hypothetical protein